MNLDGLRVRGLGPLTPFPIATNPAGGTVFEGQRVELEVFMLSSRGYLFQWQHQTDALGWNDILGATSHRLVFPFASTNDAGSYRVVIDALGCTNRVTPAAKLTVFMRPRLAIPQVSIDGHVQLSGSTEPSFSYEVEKSFDLSNWTHFATLSNAPAIWELSDTNSPAMTNRFYRVRLLR